MLRCLATAAGLVAPGRVSPHSLRRHTFATTALDAGVPLRDVQDFLGHRDPRTTRETCPATPPIPSLHSLLRPLKRLTEGNRKAVQGSHVSLSDQLAFIDVAVASAALLATIVIPWMLHRLGVEAGKAAAEAAEQTRLLQAELFRIAAQTRRDELMGLLGKVQDKAVLEALRDEADRYTGNDLALLQAVYRQNPLSPLPTHGALNRAAFDDYVRSLPCRLAPGNRGWEGQPDVLRFVSLATQAAPGEQWKLAHALYEGTRAKPLPHNFFREVVMTDWRMAAPLVSTVTSDWDWQYPVRATNLLTGVFVGLIDIDRRPGGRGHKLTHDQDRELQADMLRALAGLLHRSPLTGLASIGRDSLYEQGSTEPLSALVAWMIRAAGNAVQGDEHLEMRVIENLAQVVRSVRQSRDGGFGGWGIDDEDIQVGMLRMRHKCPALWAVHGPELVDATGVPLEPRIMRKRDAAKDHTSDFFAPSDDTWPEEFEARPNATR